MDNRRKIANTGMLSFEDVDALDDDTYIKVNRSFIYSAIAMHNILKQKEAREALQAEITAEAMDLYRAVVDEVRFDAYAEYRLRSCQATVIETRHFIALKSYYTIVAFIDKRTNTMYDVLRVVYGYTATSSQHISKFRVDHPCIEYHVAR